MLNFFKTHVFDSTFHLLLFLAPLGLAAWAIWWFLGQARSIATDLLRFNPRRVWAISTVSFRESIRRKVLWITPLAILAIVVISLLQHPSDEQDALRETIKYSIFTSGLVVVMTSLILACTNLPKEIDNRVIYTIVTKPTTRLEIVVGKIVGFSRVSATLLLIMGLFTFAYVKVREKGMALAARDRLLTMSGVDPDRPLLEHYVSDGLLHARSYEYVPAESPNAFPAPGTPDRLGLEFYAGSPGSDAPQIDPARRWIEGDEVEYFRVAYDLGPDVLPPATEDDPEPDAGPLVIRARVPYRPVWHPSLYLGAYWSPSNFSFFPWSDPQVQFHVLDANGDAVLMPAAFQIGQIAGGQPVSGSKVTLPPPDVDKAVEITLPPKSVQALRHAPGDPHSPFKRIYISVSGVDRSKARCQYAGYPGSVQLYNVRLDPARAHPLVQAGTVDGKPPWPVYQGLHGVHGDQQLDGAYRPNEAMVAVYHFDVPPFKQGKGDVQFEFRANIIRGGSEARTDREDATTLSLQVYRRPEGATPGEAFPPIVHEIETARTSFINVPVEELAGGHFDVMLRCLTYGHYVGLYSTSLAAVRGENSFALNLAKSMLILWGMSVLVIIISILSSTFVSWPIAIVLSIIVLTGRWGVDQLADAMQPGIGHQVATDIFGKGLSPAGAEVISESVENLRVMATNLAKVLPDLTRFDATDRIARGVDIPLKVLGGAAKGLVLYGLPIALLAYLILKGKEVAP